jgi:hypothetical protein
MEAVVAGRMDITGIDRRARTAGYADGLLELFAAAVLLTLAFGWIANPGIVGILAAFIVLYGWKLVERVKARLTYPRIGYFREREDEASTNARGMLLFIGGAFLLTVMVVWLSGGIADAAEWRRAAPLVSGISLSGGFWYLGDKSGLVRHRLIACWSVISGVGLWLFGSGSDYSGVALHLFGLAVPLALLGAWSLWHFLRSHPVREGQ